MFFLREGNNLFVWVITFSDRFNAVEIYSRVGQIDIAGQNKAMKCIISMHTYTMRSQSPGKLYQRKLSK